MFVIAALPGVFLVDTLPLRVFFVQLPTVVLQETFF